MRVLPSRHTTLSVGGFGRSTFSAMPCLKKNSSSAVSESATTVSPLGPAPGRVIPTPVSPEASKRAALSALLKT